MPETNSRASGKGLNLHDGVTNRITGETFKVVSETPESITFHCTVQQHGCVPFEHIHLNQDEVFQIRKGDARMVIDGKETIAKPGDIVRIPKGKQHIVFNNQPEVLDCLISSEPALDRFSFFQGFGGLTVDNDMDNKGEINIPKMLYLYKEDERALPRQTCQTTTDTVWPCAQHLMRSRKISRVGKGRPALHQQPRIYAQQHCPLAHESVATSIEYHLIIVTE